MKKLAVLAVFMVFLIFPTYVHAASDIIPPASPFYFLQTFAENIRLSLNFSKEGKFNYLLSLTDKRVEEMKNSVSPNAIKLYEKHYQYLDKLALQMDSKEQAVQKIEENNLRQQAVLAKVYIQAPESAKGAVLGAQKILQNTLSKQLKLSEVRVNPKRMRPK